jgi:pimeloyl-ACP methyl ester carboxylesterase
MTELYDFSRAVTHPHRVAVLFVHGIDGDYKSTWGVQENCWIDWLTGHLPNVGIYSFSHEASKSDYINIFSHEEIADHLAKQLAQLGSLQTCILICHSLGGLIAKQAVIKYRRAAFSNIKSFKFVFFGTPHQGLRVPWLSPVLSFFIHKRHPVRLILANIRELQMLNNNFLSAIGQESEILSYYENQKTFGFHLVPRRATIVGGIYADTIAIKANHVDMCKFTSKQSTVFLSIVDLIGSEERKHGSLKITPFSVPKKFWLL